MEKQILTVITLLATALFHPAVQALAMAEIQINSSLNQPLDAVIDLSAEEDELLSLQMSVSRLEALSAGIQRWPGLKIKLIREENGRNYIKITSKEVIREPILGFVLELDWSKGRIRREYSLLMDLQ
jgi:pilus assembly protein FimV